MAALSKEALVLLATVSVSMSEQIQVGDLVMVVRTCCDGNPIDHICKGEIHTVLLIDPTTVPA